MLKFRYHVLNFVFVIREAFVATRGDVDFDSLDWERERRSDVLLLRSHRERVSYPDAFYHLQLEPAVNCGKGSIGKDEGILLVIQSVPFRLV